MRFLSRSCIAAMLVILLSMTAGFGFACTKDTGQRYLARASSAIDRLEVRVDASVLSNQVKDAIKGRMAGVRNAIKAFADDPTAAGHSVALKLINLLADSTLSTGSADWDARMRSVLILTRSVLTLFGPPQTRARNADRQPALDTLESKLKELERACQE